MKIPKTQDPLQARTFVDDEWLLDDVLTEAISETSGSAVMELNDQAVTLARRAREGDDSAAEELSDLVSGLDSETAGQLVSSLIAFFWLNNLAEDNERIRRVRARELADPDTPRRGSVRAAILRLAAGGVGAREMSARLEKAEIRLVMTAHPTEARRRTTLEKQARIFSILRDLDERLNLPGSRAAARTRLLATTQELWASDGLRAASLTPLDEARAGLVYFVSTLADVVPRIYRDIESALAEAYPDETPAVGPVLTFGTWIGGDRDGNPHVTPAVTEEVLALMREQCLRLLESRVALLAGRLSLSERIVGEAPGLDAILKDGAERFGDLAETLDELNPEEPYRRALSFMRERIRATAAGEDHGYEGPGALMADLRVVEASLNAGGGALAAMGDLHDVIRQVEVFGFHFARLDIRDHAARHRAALGEILDVLGVHEAYAALPESERCDLLCREIEDPRPLIPADTSGFTDETQSVIETFRMLRRVFSGEHRDAIGSYIVSGTEGPGDLLEVLLLMKECALTRAGGHEGIVPIVPLFESGETLRGAALTLGELLDRSPYRSALRAVGDEQEVMIGYSDSNKDTGYAASGWATYAAQVEVAELLRPHGISWTFFHGRGGAVGRGGGPTSVAVAALPPGTVEGRLKMTEQGEVLATKYAVPEIAYRELELTCSAVFDTLGDDHEPVRAPATRERNQRLMDAISASSARTYSTLVHEDPDFVEFFSKVTPVDEISRLRLGSRPARRSAATGIADLRAIPWVFSWTQARIILPAWFGLGSALREIREREGAEALKEMRAEWPFFAALLSNAEMACAKADLQIGRRYVDLYEEPEPRERIWGVIEGEFERTCHELLLLSDQVRLLDGEPVLQASIDRRNPFVDPLSFVQVELLRRLRAATAPEPDLERASLLTVNGIAGGLRNTG